MRNPNAFVRPASVRPASVRPLRTGAHRRLRHRALAALAATAAAGSVTVGLAATGPPAGAAPASTVNTGGGFGLDRAEDVAIEPFSGDSIVVGTFSDSIILNAPNGPTPLGSAGGTDGYVARYHADGSLVWARKISGVLAEEAHAVAVDQATGGIYVVGVATSAVTSFGNDVTSSAFAQDAFVAKYSADGSAAWVRTVTGSSTQSLNDVAVTGGKVYAVGSTTKDSKVWFGGSDPQVGTTPVSTGASGLYVGLQTSGTPDFVRAEGNGSFSTVFEGVAVQGALVAVTGRFTGSTTLGSGAGKKTLTATGQVDGLAATYVGSSLAWASKFGSTANDSGLAVALDGTKVLVAGSTGTLGLVQTFDLLNGTLGHKDTWTGSATAESIAVGPFGVISVVGRFTGTMTVPWAAGTPQEIMSAGSSDAYLLTLDPNGAGGLALEADGGSLAEAALGHAVTPFGTAVVAGAFSSSNVSFGNLDDRSSVGSSDTFVVRYRTGPAFHAMTPFRILDTRTGVGSPATKIPAGTGRAVPVRGVGGVPAENVVGVVLNVTATGGTADSHLRVFPSGSAAPNASNLNFVAGQTVPNLVVSRLGADGKVVVYNNSGSTDAIADVVGWFDDDAVGARFQGINPNRIFDTRAGGGSQMGAGETRSFTVAGVGGVPADAVAVVANVTVTQPTSASHLTVWPSGKAKPDASNLNWVAGQTVPNLVVAKIGSDKKVSVFNNAGKAHVIVDVVGYHTRDAVEGQLVLANPTRLLDTRDGTGGPKAPLAEGATRTLHIAGIGNVPKTAKAVVVTFTVTNPTKTSHLTVWPGTQAQPDASNLNFVAGRPWPTS